LGAVFGFLPLDYSLVYGCDGAVGKACDQEVGIKMRIALYRVFKKNALLLLTVMLLFCGWKWLGVHQSAQPGLKYLVSWSRQLQGADTQTLEKYFQDVAQQIGEDPVLQQMAKQDLQKLNQSIRNVKTVDQLISFGKELAGPLPAGLPRNYLELLPFYSQLDRPNVMDEGPLDCYFSLQKQSIVPILTLLLSAVFWGVHYEEQLHKYTRTVYKGRSYECRTEAILSVLCLILLGINELFDLLFSGLLRQPWILQSSVQSYSPFRYAQLDRSFGMLLLEIGLSKILGVLILSKGVRLLAQKCESLKKTLVGIFLLLLMLTVISTSLDGHIANALVQLGCVDWYSLVRDASIILPLGITAFPLGIGLLAFLYAVLVIAQHKYK